MSNNIKIGVQAQFDASQVEQQINALGQKIAAANKVQFKPLSGTTAADVQKITAQFQQLLKVHGELRKRIVDTGQKGLSLTNLDWEQLYVDPAQRAKQMRRAFEYSVGSQFSALPAPPAPAPGAPTPPGQPPKPTPAPPPGVATTATVGVVQSGLNAAGPVGGVVSNAIGTTMRSGFGAGMGGLLGGLGALAVGGMVGAVRDHMESAEQSAIALDKLKRTLGDVNVSFSALKAGIYGASDAAKITYAEGDRLALDFVKRANLRGDDFRTLPEELTTGVGMSRAFGVDTSQGVGVLAQMRGLGITNNTQESRRMALLIGETIAKSDAFANADRVMEAIAGFAESQTRRTTNAANVGEYAAMLSGVVSSKIPGLDVQGAASLLGRVNATLSQGGAKGEASQFFTGEIGARLGLDPIQTRIFREGGAFATGRQMFGEGSAAKAFGIDAPEMENDGRTMLELQLDMLRKKYGNDEKLLADATANHLGIGINEAMRLHKISPKVIGDMQEFANVKDLNFTGLANLATAVSGSDSDRRNMAMEFVARKDVSKEDKERVRSAMDDPAKLRELLIEVSKKYGQADTDGSRARNLQASVDNIKTAMASELIPLTNQIRLGIMHIAGKGEKSSVQVMEDIMRVEGGEKAAKITDDFKTKRSDAAAEAEAARFEHRMAIEDFKKNSASMSPEQREAAQKRIGELWERRTRKEEEVRLRLIDLHKEEAEAIKEHQKALKESIDKMRKEHRGAMSPPEIKKDVDGDQPDGGAPGAAPGSARPGVFTGGGRGGAGDGGSALGGSGAKLDTTAYDQKLADAEKKTGLPPGTLRAVMEQETGGNQSYVNDPGKYHYPMAANGKRYAPDGRQSSAFGPFGILADSTAIKPGYGVSPLRDKGMDEQIRFASEYLAARVRSAGSLEGGLAGYGEGPAYANSVMRRMKRIREQGTGQPIAKPGPAKEGLTPETATGRAPLPGKVESAPLPEIKPEERPQTGKKPEPSAKPAETPKAPKQSDAKASDPLPLPLPPIPNEMFMPWLSKPKAVEPAAAPPGQAPKVEKASSLGAPAVGAASKGGKEAAVDTKAPIKGGAVASPSGPRPVMQVADTRRATPIDEPRRGGDDGSAGKQQQVVVSIPPVDLSGQIMVAMTPEASRMFAARSNPISTRVQPMWNTPR